ncbi:GNAT family N-acetyltransferase [Sphingomonas oleivorans]|uniref:GNAT family N-acetyltransferase n=1 Tax=Sphingomonas oleivorans TaxID=1735121 RepID=A0A2T5FXT5_9SPHN|nr:arsinothricin resistance N-acetyltransferase ArsN1 family B [Sphingomonas oleivorans]PTQ10932.1 GNAT family N-acetyltransferase [Sphingomonas oleivorans]
MSFRIRAVTPDDAGAIAAIYAPYVEDTAITFELAPAPDAAEMRRRIASIAGRFPYLVAEQDGALLGYAYAGLYRTRPAYRWVVETTVYVAMDAQRRGIGRALYAELLDRLKALGHVAAVGVIALPNAASVALHEALGFTHAGTQRAIGHKLSQWYDVGFWQVELAERIADPPLPLES